MAHFHPFIPLQGAHQIFGVVALVVAVVNPIGAVFRPECDAENRWVFNWIHWLVGNIGHISAIAAIFLAFQLTTIRLSPAYLWSIAFYLFFHLTSHSLLQLYFCNCRHTKGKLMQFTECGHCHSILFSQNRVTSRAKALFRATTPASESTVWQTPPSFVTFSSSTLVSS